MRIGIDARMYRSSIAGIGRYSQNLIKNLLSIDHENEYVLFMTPEDAEEYEKENFQNKNVELRVVKVPHYSIEEQTSFLKEISKKNLDLMHFLNFNYPIRFKGKFIVTIHDLTLFFYPATARETSWIKKLAFKKAMKSACQNSSKIIAISENTKKDIVDMFATNADKIKVIYEAANDKIFKNVKNEDIKTLKEKYAIGDKPVVISVGQMRAHKNIVGLINAFEILRKEIDCKLVLVGKSDALVKQALDKSEVMQDIVMPGFVSDNELATWYKLANVFVFPSFYEGFGLPGLEAMEAGLPVASSDASSLPEVYKEGALYFDPKNTLDIAEKIKLIITNEAVRKSLIEKGFEIAKSFSWEKTAQETLKLYQEIK